MVTFCLERKKKQIYYWQPLKIEKSNNKICGKRKSTINLKKDHFKRSWRKNRPFLDSNAHLCHDTSWPYLWFSFFLCAKKKKKVRSKWNTFYYFFLFLEIWYLIMIFIASLWHKLRETAICVFWYLGHWILCRKKRNILMLFATSKWANFDFFLSYVTKQTNRCLKIFIKAKVLDFKTLKTLT